MAIGTTAALLGAAAIGTAGSFAAGAMQAGAAKDAAAAQAGAAAEASQVQRDAITQTRIDSYPWAIAGAQALYAYMGELGIPMPKDPILPNITEGPFGYGGSQSGTQAAATPNYPWLPGSQQTQSEPSPYENIEFTERKGFQETPGYQFQVEQGERGVLNNLSALGMRDSGAALKSLTNYRMGIANQEYNNYLNRLAGAAGMGQSQVQSNNAMTQTAATNIGNAVQNAGAARASGYVGAANAWGGAIGNTTNMLGGLMGQLGGGGGNALGAGYYMNTPGLW